MLPRKMRHRRCLQNRPHKPKRLLSTGFFFSGKYYYDRCLPMGCSSSSQIFERISDAIVHILTNKFGVKHVIKVLDDFLFIANSFEECERCLNCFRKVCSNLNIKLAEHKTMGPDTKMTFLGIHLNSITLEASIPKQKISACMNAIIEFSCKEYCTFSELKSIIGKLQFTTSVITSGQGRI